MVCFSGAPASSGTENMSETRFQPLKPDHLNAPTLSVYYLRTRQELRPMSAPYALYVSVICHEGPILPHTLSIATAHHQEGTVVEYSCSGGHEATAGDSIRICEAADQKPMWTGKICNAHYLLVAVSDVGLTAIDLVVKPCRAAKRIHKRIDIDCVYMYGELIWPSTDRCIEDPLNNIN